VSSVSRNSISSLSSLDNAFADAKLRRESSSSISSMTMALNSNTAKVPSDGRTNNDGNTLGGTMPFAPNLRQQSDSVLDMPSHGGKGGSSLPTRLGNNNNSINNSMQNPSNVNFGVGGMGSMKNSMNNNAGMTLQQQQFLASIRQQQQQLSQKMSVPNPNSFMMNASANPAMGMIGGGNFPMVNQQAFVQQQQNALNFNMLQQQQQQSLLLQQQQQSMTPSGLSLHNISIMQQQQQHENAIRGRSGSSNTAVNMNMMNSSNLHPVIPRVGVMGNVPGLGANLVNNNSSMMDMMNMPPPGGATTPQQQRSLTGSNPANDGSASPLSPGSFNW
jgi:hypothetical protein